MGMGLVRVGSGLSRGTPGLPQQSLGICTLEKPVPVTNFLVHHLHMFSSCWTVVSLLHHVFTLIIPQYILSPCFYLHMFTIHFLTHVFHTCHLHAIYMPLIYLYITCHASMTLLYINLSVDIASSLASL